MVHTTLHADIHTRTHVCTCTYTHMPTHSYILAHVRTLTDTHLCIQSYTHARTHAHTHTHTQSTLNCSPNATDITGRAELNISNIIQLLMIYTIMNSSLRAYNTFNKPLSLRCCVILAVIWIIPEYCRTQPLMLP